MEESGEGRLFVVVKKEIVPMCHFQLALEMTPYTLSMEQESEEVFIHGIKRGTVENERRSIRAARRKN